MQIPAMEMSAATRYPSLIVRPEDVDFSQIKINGLPKVESDGAIPKFRPPMNQDTYQKQVVETGNKILDEIAPGVSNNIKAQTKAATETAAETAAETVAEAATEAATETKGFLKKIGDVVKNHKVASAFVGLAALAGGGFAVYKNTQDKKAEEAQGANA